MGHIPKYGKGKWKTNRKEHSSNAMPERSDKSLRTRRGCKFSGTATRTGQGLSRCGRSQEHRCILPEPAMERPRTLESVPVRGSNGCVRCTRKSDPMNERTTTLCVHHYGRWLSRQMKNPKARTDDWRDRDTSRGLQRRKSLRISDHKRSVHPPKQCNRPPTMKRSGQLGCRASEPARQPSRLKGLTRDPNTRQVLGCLARGPTGGRPAGSQLAAVVSA